MVIVPEGSTVSRNFSKAACHYDRWALHQRRIAQRLVQHLPEGPPARTILELGCGTGILTALLRRRYPDAEITAVDIAPGMIEYCRRLWPVTDGIRFTVGAADTYTAHAPCDLLASSCSFQWFSDRRAVAAHCVRQLTPRGILALAVPIEGTLPELTESFRAATGAARPRLDLWSEERYAALLTRAGLELLTVSTEDVCVSYDSPQTVLQALKGMGATFRGQPGFRPRAFTEIRRLVSHYRTRFATAQGQVTATYRVLYLVARPNRSVRKG